MMSPSGIQKPTFGKMKPSVNNFSSFRSFIKDLATNYDCDEDSHKYDTGCRVCNAKDLLKRFPENEQQNVVILPTDENK